MKRNSNKDTEWNIENTFLFSQLPTNELLGLYYDYSFEDDCEGFRYLPINRGISMFQLASSAKLEMMRIYSLKDWQIHINKENDNVDVIILFAGIINNTRIIKKEMKRLGFISMSSLWIRRDLMIWRAIKFVPCNKVRYNDIYKEKKYEDTINRNREK